jgi:hypothetical protein
MGYPSLTPLYGLGSYGRITGAPIVSTPRATFGSSQRIYAYLKYTKGIDYTLNYFNNIAFGPYRINNSRTGLVYK